MPALPVVAQMLLVIECGSAGLKPGGYRVVK